MKKMLMLVWLHFVAIGLFAQTNQEIFNANEITWFGLDFTKAKLMGSFAEFNSAGQKDENDIRLKYFPAWNNVIVQEKEKYDLPGVFRKNEVNYNLEIVHKRNFDVKNDDLFEINPGEGKHLDEKAVQDIISQYDVKGGKGVGIVFIVETLDKYSESGTYFVTFFDIATKKVLLTQRMTGQAGGIGLRNYWIKPVFNVLKQCRSEYPKWKKKAGK
jgi:hypothetical protein